MADFSFLKIPNFENWVVSAPKRSKRPDHPGFKKACPFCPGNEKKEIELFRIGGEYPDAKWQVRVIPNKFPFAPSHELVIHSREHEHGHISDLPLDHIKLIIETYVERYNTYKKAGTVCIFRNAGREAGESIGHAHSQIVIVPKDIEVAVPRLEDSLGYRKEYFEVGEFTVVCPPFSQWPDEVWIVPKRRGRTFGEISYEEIESFSYILRRLIRILDMRHGHNFPNNYYIYPNRDWYIRLIPRAKIAGGFEIMTGIFVNTQDPRETMKFIKDNFYEEDEEEIRKHKAEYRKGV